MSSSASKKRNFVIKKRKNLDKIFKILNHEANSSNNTEALNTLGFLYYHGVEM